MQPYLIAPLDPDLFYWFIRTCLGPTVFLCERFRDANSELLSSDFIWDFGKLPFPEHLGKYFIKIGKISAKIHEIGKIKAIFGLE